MHAVEHLPITIPDFDKHHPFARSQKPAYYKSSDLSDSAEGKTHRTSFFEKYLVGLYWTLGRPVPYAFVTDDGGIRSLDAHSLKFLLNRSTLESTLVCDASGTIVAVETTPPSSSDMRSCARSYRCLRTDGITELSSSVAMPAGYILSTRFYSRRFIPLQNKKHCRLD